ncbi:MAG: efflux RND transporter periplasmic adaptor subunit [Planctomycetaceae bacterium]|nr:efflux RND transporter periplasmic adaptor subunit [Planctomycetaceae bacterium]
MLLAGVGYYGHRSDWKMPRFATLAGEVPSVPHDWCEEHGVPESICVECNRAKFPPEPDYSWCSEHGVHNCPLHHPGAAQVQGVPDVRPDDFARAERAFAVQERQRNNAACTYYQRRIQFASVESVKQAGVDVELVERGRIVESISVGGEIIYDETQHANLSARAPGTVWRVEKKIGDRVETGEVLALIDAMAVGEAKATLMQALAEESLRRQTVERLTSIGTGAIPGRQIVDAKAEYVKAQVSVLSAEQSLTNLGLPVDIDPLREMPQEQVQEQLRFLGIPESIQSELDVRTGTSNLLPIRTPAEGVIIDRQIVSGEVVDTSRVLFQVADTTRMWLTLNVRAEDAGKIRPGLTVEFVPDGTTEKVAGTLSWISTAADSETRMVRVRADLANTDGRLRDESFGSGRIILREEPEAILVPVASIHNEGCCQVVFVRDRNWVTSPESPKVFHVRTVRVGARTSEQAEIIAGVLPGEVVVSKGSDVLRAQLLKNNLGEGCTCGAD